MGLHRKAVLDSVKNLRSNLKEQTKNADKEKIYYLYFERLFSYEDIERFFKGKYTYKELKSIIKEKYDKF